MGTACVMCSLPTSGSSFMSATRCLYQSCPHRTIDVDDGDLVPHPPMPALAYGRAKNGSKVHLLDWTGTFAVCKLEIKTEAHPIAYERRDVYEQCQVCNRLVRELVRAESIASYRRDADGNYERVTVDSVTQWAQPHSSAAKRLWTLMLHEPNQANLNIWLAAVVMEYGAGWAW